jgi:hypothetical protein
LGDFEKMPAANLDKNWVWAENPLSALPDKNWGLPEGLVGASR